LIGGALAHVLVERVELETAERADACSIVVACERPCPAIAASWPTKPSMSWS
jgi:hypothetical protein